MIKLLQIVTTYQSLVTILDSKLHYLETSGEVELFTVSSPPEQGECRVCAGKFTSIYIARMVNPVTDLISLCKLYLYIKKHKFDIIHTHTAKAGQIGAIAGWFAGVPVIHTYHGLPYFNGQNVVSYLLYKTAESVLCLLRSVIFSQNEIDLSLLQKGVVTKNRSFFEGNSVDIETIERNASADIDKIPELFSSEKYHLLCISRLETIKSLDKVLRVVRYLKDRNIGVECIIAGKGHLDTYIQKQIQNLQIQDSVKVVYTSYVHALISKADLLILTSMKEGVPRSVLEAMALKKAVIATDVQGTHEIVTHNVNGILVPYDDQDALNRQTELLMQNKAQRVALGIEGRRLLTEKFSSEKQIAGIWIDKYKELTNPNVLFVTTVGFTTEAFLIPYIALFKAHKCNVDALANWNFNWNRLPDTINKISVPFSRSAFSLTNVIAFLRCIDVLRKKKYSIIYTHTPNASMIIRAAKILSFSKAKVIYEIHGLHVHEKGNKWANALFTIIETAFAFVTDTIITINNDDYTFTKKHFKHSANFYAPGIGVDTNYYKRNLQVRDEIRLKYTIDNNTMCIVTIADFIKRKRIDLCIDAAKKIKDAGVSFKWLIAGTGPLLDVMADRIKKYGLQSDVILTGHQSDVRQVLSVADIFVLLSTQEGLPRSIMEAASMGIPVVASDIRGNRDIICHAKNSFLIPLESPDIIAKHIITLINDSAMRIEFGEQIQKTILEKYSLQNALKEHEKIFFGEGSRLTPQPPLRKR